MTKRKLTLQEHLNHPNYGFRFGLVLKNLEEQYSWDTEEITSEEDVILVITLSLEQNIPPAKIAEQLDAQLKAKEEEEIEPISAPTKSVGMFESDLWEHEMGGPTMGPWELPYAKGGFLHTPRIESPRSSPHYVPVWQKVRTYGQDHPEKTRQEISKDLGVPFKTVANALRGTIGLIKGSFAQAHPGLPAILVTESPKETKRRASMELLYGRGDRQGSEEQKDIVVEEIRNAFVERMTQEDERDQREVILELGIEYKIHPETIRTMLGDLWDPVLAWQAIGEKGSATSMITAGTSHEEIKEYLREFGTELSDYQISKALGVGPAAINRVRKKLKIKFPKYNIKGYPIIRRSDEEE